MISFVLLFLVVLWLLGYLQVPLFNVPLFSIIGRPITLNDILVFVIIIWLMDLLPYPFKEIALVLFLLWILATVGIIAVAGFSQIVLIALIVGLIVFMTSITKTA